MTTEKKTPQYQQLYLELRRRLLRLAPGDGFASIRNLLREFGVSQATAVKAVDLLVRDGLLERRLGRGSTVTAAVLRFRDGALPFFALALPVARSPASVQAENDFLALQTERRFVGEVWHCDGPEAATACLAARKIDGLLVMPGPDAGTVLLPEAWGRLGIPFAFCGTAFRDGTVSFVCTDDEFSGLAAADCLIKLGHTRLAVLVAAPRTPRIADRINGFCRYVRLQQASVRVIDCGLRPGEETLPPVYRKMRELTAAGALDFTALLVVDETSCLAVFKACREAGIGIPADLSVIGIGNSGESEFFSPSLTTVDTSLRRELTVGLDLLGRLRNRDTSSPPIRVGLEAPLLVRESTGKCRA